MQEDRKNLKKSISKEWKKRIDQDLIQDLPFSLKFFNDFLIKLISAIDEQTETAEDPFELSRKILSTEPNLEQIIEWFEDHDAFCDDDIIEHIVDEYQDLLTTQENNYFDFLDKIFAEKYKETEEADTVYSNDTRYDLNYYKSIYEEKTFEINLTCGVKINKLKKPWGFFTNHQFIPARYFIKYGKGPSTLNKLDAFEVNVFQIPLPSELLNYADFSEKHILKCQNKDGNTLELTVATVENNPDNITVTWIYDANNPVWYLRIGHRPKSFKSEKQIFIQLLQENISYTPNVNYQPPIRANLGEYFLLDYLDTRQTIYSVVEPSITRDLNVKQTVQKQQKSINFLTSFIKKIGSFFNKL